MEERKEPTGGNFDGGFNTLICEEDDEEHSAYRTLPSNRNQVSMFGMSPGRRYRLAAVSLVLLAGFLLILNIGLGVHYNKLTDTHLTLEDTERISKELVEIQETYKTAVKTMKDARQKLDNEMRNQTQTNWELEHQNKRTNDYKVQIDKITKEIATMKSHLPLIDGGCRNCPAGWILMNSVCYYIPKNSNGIKTWQQSRDFCKLYGGDLIVIDSQDEEKYTVNYLINNYEESSSFWIGLRDLQEEGTWKWVDGTILVEGFWNDGEPNDLQNEDCAAIIPKENFFKAWNDFRCGMQLKWICEKAITSRN